MSNVISLETQVDQNAVDVTVTCQGRCGITFVDEIYFLEDVCNVFNRSRPTSFRDCRSCAWPRSPQKKVKKVAAIIVNLVNKNMCDVLFSLIFLIFIVINMFTTGTHHLPPNCISILPAVCQERSARSFRMPTASLRWKLSVMKPRPLLTAK